MGICFKMSTVEGVLWVASLLAHFSAMCYYCYSNNSRTVRLISPAPGTKKNSPKISANFSLSGSKRKLAELFGYYC